MSVAILEKLKAESGVADEAVTYADVALQLDAPDETLHAEAEEELTLEEMEAKVNELLGTTSGDNTTPVGVLFSGVLPDLTLPARIDEGITQEGDSGIFPPSYTY